MTNHAAKQMLMEMQVHTSGAEVGILKTPGRESLIPDSAIGLTYGQIVEIGSGVQELRGSAGVCPCTWCTAGLLPHATIGPSVLANCVTKWCMASQSGILAGSFI